MQSRTLKIGEKNLDCLPKCESTKKSLECYEISNILICIMSYLHITSRYKRESRVNIEHKDDARIGYNPR